MKQGRISVSTRRQQSLAKDTICHSEPGIHVKVAAALFYPLTRTKGYGQDVGMRINRSLMKAPNGRRWAERHMSGGTFHYTLDFAP